MGEMKKQKIVVVGAGPVGALAALYAAGRGDDVEVYELRGDLRDPSTVPLNFTKSINLALSERGINSMKNANCPGLVEAVLEETIPMFGRMIHGAKQGELFEESQSYDVHGRYIRAVDRAGLNKRLLDELEKMPNVKFFFDHKLVGADFRKNRAWFERRSKTLDDHAQNPTKSDPVEAKASKSSSEVEVAFDFMIGADGAHSAVRYHLMKFARLNYQQEYIDTLWCEFHISPSPTNDFKLSPNHLHIWPGGEFMFIAIPSLDKSFTSTLFLPASRFAELDAQPERLVGFFNENFPGVAGDLISESDLRKQYDENPHLPLISIKCSPYHYKSSVVILGDAAHAMVPFYGQGMNAGLEDVRTLFEFLDRHRPKILQADPDALAVEVDAHTEGRMLALEEYTRLRTPDAAAINDLALRNYQEMRSDVTSPIYRLRKWVEEALNNYFPKSGFATQYSRVSFGNERYSIVEKEVQRQGKWLLSGIVGVGLVPFVAWGGWWLWRWNRASHTGRGLTKWAAILGSKTEQIGRKFT
ncbi:kynurenine 3-monooxygenase-like protein [Cryomyces antarcticus]|uniref:Kynurenine 3-monooxygenase n=1 Tax=Cryomyces antarcticus TaxID=329879 RepID=A0ABR0LQX2_9PEZI|nr:kynurenine 3-monooxygenase, mitochondrial precursor [Cryomyces antarcticus]